ncbi:hypothetical protein [Arthrobacter sp. NPDC056727]|uniref:hypothetical protein n=1 Tax=Arthrobacter sp. NPDC056727 TaxID=3345927 RepID=UPI0036710ABE
MEAVGETYTNAEIMLRPGRVAIMFSADDHWRRRARQAIAAAGNYWGGSGFILVPYQNDGTVEPKVMAAVHAYDPDHVVALRLTNEEWERVSLPYTPDSGEKISPASPVHVLDLPTVDSVARRARDFVAKQCTPFRQAFPGDDEPRETLTYIDAEVGPRSGWLAPVTRASGSILLAVSESWGSDAGLCLSIRTGIIPSAKEVVRGAGRMEPDHGQMMKAALAERWSREFAEDLVANLNVNENATGSDVSFWFDEQAGGLASVRHRFSGEGGAIVIGDTAEDFALAYAYERLLGFGIWLSPGMLAERNLSASIRSQVRLASERIEGQGERLLVTSSSCNEEELSGLAAQLKIETWDVNPLNAASTGEIEQITALPEGMEVGKPMLKAGLHQLAVEEPFGLSQSVPAFTGPDSTLHLRVPMSTPTPARLLVHADQRSKPYWYVSVELTETAMPRGRGVPQAFVEPDQKRYSHNAVRSSRDGLSYHSQAGGLVLAGTSLASQLYRPKLKVLGMQPWVEAMAKQAEMDVVQSLPGMHAQLLARRLGGRNSLVSMVSGQYHPALQMFATKTGTRSAQSSRQVFPRHDGVVLGSEPYPSFQALSRVLPGVGPREIRDWIDGLAQAGLLWRGFILNCSDCSRPSFVRVEHLGQRFECQRCLAVNELSAARWRADTNEPPWFYDLHPSFRELMATNGDVGLFAARSLSQGTREYADTAELEFHKVGTRGSVAEIDLIAHVDGEVFLVEAKSNGRLGSNSKEARAAAKKKVEIALAIRADKIILATTAQTLATSARELLQSAVRTAGVSQIRVEELVGLGPTLAEPGTPPAAMEV